MFVLPNVLRIVQLNVSLYERQKLIHYSNGTVATTITRDADNIRGEGGHLNCERTRKTSWPIYQNKLQVEKE